MRKNYLFSWRNLKSFIVMITCMGTSFMYAQTDVTSTYLINAGFDEAADFTMESQGTKDPGNVQQNITGWNVENLGGWAAGYVYGVGSGYQINSATVPATTADGLNMGGVLAISVGWGNTLSFSQTVTLPEGRYRMEYDVFNAGTDTRGISVVGWVPNSGTSVLSTKNSFGLGTWEKDVIEFVVDGLTTGKIQIGFRSQNVTSNNNAKPCFDNIKLYTVYFPEELLTAAKLLNENAILGDNKTLEDVFKNLILPTSIGEGISVSWESSRPTIINISGEVTPLEEFEASVTLTATLSYTLEGKTYTLQKKFVAYVYPNDPVAIIARWDFSDETIDTEAGVTKIKALDQDGNPSSKYIGTIMNEASIRTIGNPSKQQYNVLYLAEGTGHFDLGTETGKAIYNLSKDYTMSAYFRVEGDAPEQTAVGNFIWCFSNTENAASNNQGYMFMRPTEVRWAITQPSSSEQTLSGSGGTNYYTNNGNTYAGRWHHIMYIQRGNTGYIYLDGSLAAEKEGITYRPADFANSSIAGEGTPYNWLGRACFAQDRYLRKAMIYDFQILAYGLTDGDMYPGNYMGNIAETLMDLDEAYYDNNNYISDDINNALAAINLTGDLSAVKTDFNLPLSNYSGVTTQWTSTQSNIIEVAEVDGQLKAVVTRPKLYDTSVTLTVTLTKGIHQVSKTFEVTVSSVEDNEFSGNLLVHYDFSQVNGRTVTDVAEKGFKGTLMNDAGILTLKTPDDELINVLNLGNGTGYFDLGYEIGQIMYNTTDYTLSAFYYIDENYPSISSNGNFLWTFSNSATSGGSSQYVIAILKDQRVEMRGSTNETFGIRNENNAYVPAPKGRWVHFAYTQEGEIGTIYVDGMSQANATIYNIPAYALPVEGRTGTLYNWIGRSCYAGDVYLRQTYVYDFRMYNRALSDVDFGGGEFDVTGILEKLNNAEPAVGLSKIVKDSPYKVYFLDRQLIVEGLTGGEKISLYDITGRQYQINSEKTLAIQPGIYIVKINNFTTKALVK